jgi:hypothetical protein
MLSFVLGVVVGILLCAAVVAWVWKQLNNWGPLA